MFSQCALLQQLVLLHRVLYQHALLRVHGQQPPKTWILSCIFWLQQPHVKGGQVIIDIFEPSGVQLPKVLFQSSD